MKTVTQLAADLAELGVASGDRLVVHSSLRALGRVDGGPTAVVEALRAVLGPQGTVVVPTFNYFLDGKSAVDLRSVAGRTGAISEAVRHQAGAVRSDHPTHSVTALGADAVPLTEHHLTTRAFGVGSPLSRVAQSGGKVLLLGVAHTSNSTMHVAEEHSEVPKPDPPEGLETVEVNCVDGRVEHCTLDTSPSCSLAFGGAEAELRRRGSIRDALVGDALAQLMTGQAIFDAVETLLGQDRQALLCTRPTCQPCVRTRKALQEEEESC